jgi:hypothetical protein
MAVMSLLYFDFLLPLSSHPIGLEIKEDESVGTMKRSRVSAALVCLFSYGNLPITTTSAFSVRPTIDRTAISTSATSVLRGTRV